MTQTERILVYSGAAIRAVLFYVVLYLAIVHLFVAWKWRTTELDDEWIEIEYFNPVVVAPADEKTVVEVPTEEEVEKLLLGIEASQTKLGEVPLSQVNKLLDGYHSTLRNWEYWDFDASATSVDNNNNTTAATAAVGDNSSLLPEGRKSIKIVSFVNLLLKAALSEMEDDDILKWSFQMAIREFQGLADHKSEVKWDVIHDLLTPTKNGTIGGYPTKAKLSQQQLREMTCPAPVMEVAEEEAEDEPTRVETADIEISLYVEESDLDTYFRVVEAILEKRNESVKDYLLMNVNGTVAAALNESVYIVEQDLKDAQTFTDESIETFRRQVQEGNSNVSTSEATTALEVQCVAKDDVFELLEEGIRATIRRADLRTALLKKAEELDPSSTEGLILDAIFDMETPLPDEANPSSTINIRRLLDTPMLRHAIVGIDALSEWVRLHSDRLDKLVETLRGERQGASPGEILISHLLQLTGTMEIVVPESARRLLLRSKTGHDLLT